MAVDCMRPSETEEKKYHHNVAIAAVFDNVYGCLYFVAKTPQAEVKGTGMLTYGSEEGKPCDSLLVLHAIQRRR